MDGTAEECGVSAFRHAQLPLISRGRILFELWSSKFGGTRLGREGTNAMDSMKRPGSGEAPTGAEPIHLRLLPHQLAALDQWIAHELDMPSRPEAVRRLLVLGLTVTSKKR